MSLSQHLERQLDRIGDGTVDSLAKLETPHGRLEFKVVEANGLACAFEWIRHQGNWLDDLHEGQMRQLGDWLAKRIHYLFEPLRMIELDSVSRTLQMRSTSPTFQTDERTYFELTISPLGGITMRRFTKTAGSPRKNVAATVTREVLMRLCDDIVSSRNCLCRQTPACDESVDASETSRPRMPHIV